MRKTVHNKIFFLIVTVITAGLAVGMNWYLTNLEEIHQLNSFENLNRMQWAELTTDDSGSETKTRGAEILEYLPFETEALRSKRPLTITNGQNRSDDRLVAGQIINLTNQQRLKRELEPLEMNELLNQAAAFKLQDMLDRQYFDHYAPDGSMGAEQTAAQAGYEYLVIGENLAWGHFTDNEHLVQAWMDSPGHRANILREQFSQIGVAVTEGEYQGMTGWMAVQIFGRPRSDCQKPDQELQSDINQLQDEIVSIEQKLATQQEEIEKIRPRFSQEYSQAVESYNETIERYNESIEAVERLIENYNYQVEKFNLCLQNL